MRSTHFSALSALLFIIISVTPATLSSLALAEAQSMTSYPPLPLPTSTSEFSANPAPAAPSHTGPVAAPAHIIIPSIGLNSPIQSVGVNAKGEIAVPSGSSNNVGWYKYGARPGASGTSVIDAHVFAALKNLSKIQSGADVYVITEDKQTLHFRVVDKELYALSKLTSAQLFSGQSDSAMNIITCAGSLTADHSTYDHRLVVYTILVND